MLIIEFINKYQFLGFRYKEVFKKYERLFLIKYVYVYIVINIYIYSVLFYYFIFKIV